MNSFLREIRLIPIVLVAAGALLVLKVTGLVTQGSYTLGAGHMARSDRILFEQAQQAAALQRKPQAAVTSPAIDHSDITGSVGGSAPSSDDNTASAPKAQGKAEAQPAASKPEAAKAPPATPDGTVIPADGKPYSVSERALLERLSERRQELERREREMQMRETLLQAQERKLEAKANEIKAAEARVATAARQKDETEAARLKSLVIMYETMKPKEAAKIFDRLDMRLAVEVAQQINPRRMSEILAQMTPESAERLTTELANKSATDEKAAGVADLPKIEGRPRGN